jgi:hypothetical protein
VPRPAPTGFAPDRYTTGTFLAAPLAAPPTAHGPRTAARSSIAAAAAAAAAGVPLRRSLHPAARPSPGFAPAAPVPAPSQSLLSGGTLPLSAPFSFSMALHELGAANAAALPPSGGLLVPPWALPGAAPAPSGAVSRGTTLSSLFRTSASAGGALAEFVAKGGLTLSEERTDFMHVKGTGASTVAAAAAAAAAAAGRAPLDAAAPTAGAGAGGSAGSDEEVNSCKMRAGTALAGTAAPSARRMQLLHQLVESALGTATALQLAATEGAFCDGERLKASSDTLRALQALLSAELAAALTSVQTGAAACAEAAGAADAFAAAAEPTTGAAEEASNVAVRAAGTTITHALAAVLA